MISSSKDHTTEESIKILFSNFVRSVPDTQAIVALDGEKDTIIASQVQEGESESSFKAVSGSIKNVLDRLTRELVTSSGPVSFFDTDQNRLIFIKVKNVVLSVALKVDGSVDAALPYAYLTAEKVRNITEGRDVELDIPLIKVITDEEEQKMLRDHFFELRSSSGNFSFKVIVIGDQNVGKTSLILRHAENKFKENYLPTLGVSITTNSIDLPLRKARVNFSIWDFGGQQYFRRVRLSYYAGCQACIIVFDITNKESFENVMKWDEERKRFAGGDIPTILLANKSDLAANRVVSEQAIVELANSHGFTYFETSALTGSNVPDAFNLLAYKLVDHEAKKVEEKELQGLKEEVKAGIIEAGGNLRFGLVKTKSLFDPILQVFLEMDRSPTLETATMAKTYTFSFGMTLVVIEVSDKEYFYKQVELMKDLDGVLGFIDARKLKSPDEMAKFAQFLKLLFQSAKKETFTGSIGILCEKERYSELLSKLDLSPVLGTSQNARKSVFFYNLTDNYLLEIMDNLRMLFQALDFGTLDSSDM
ncbi:MAG: GTP-binding protein [Candidatus Lokiarchaeota archaeon]|nr:GTP-binding protein [Candidatus Lokiarchaeota archaeon]